MSLLEKAKKIVKEEKIKHNEKRLSAMELLISDPEIKKTARYSAKKMPASKAREHLNKILEEEGRLPKTKSGKIQKITYLRFKQLLPKQRKKKEL